jgi:hypothetical protein
MRTIKGAARGKAEFSLEQLANNTSIDIGVINTDRQIVISNKSNITIKGTLDYSYSLNTWTQLTAQDPIFSRIPASVTGQVWVTTLKDGASLGTYSNVVHGGLQKTPFTSIPPAELIIQDNIAECARQNIWVANTTSPGDAVSLGYSNSEFDTLTNVNGMCVIGNVGVLYASELKTVSAINTGTNVLTISSVSNGVTNLISNTAKYYAFNLPEYLTQAGYYWIDRISSFGNYGKVYYVAPVGFNPNTQKTALTGGEFVGSAITFNNCNNVNLEITIRGLRGTAITCNNCTNFTFNNSYLTAIGNAGVVYTGTGLKVTNSTINDIGAQSFYITTTSRETLLDSGTLFENVKFSGSGRFAQVHGAGIVFYGCGLTVKTCRFENSNGAACFLWGNECKLSNLYIDNTARNNADNGTVYSGRDPSFRGNSISNSTIKNHKTTMYSENAKYAGNVLAGVYLDDGVSDFTISNCLFENIDFAIRTNGGSYIVSDENTFKDCLVGFHLDNALNTWAQRRTMVPDKSSLSVAVQLSGAVNGTVSALTTLPITGAIGTGEFLWFGDTRVKVTADVAINGTNIPITSATLNLANNSIGKLEGVWEFFKLLKDVNYDKPPYSTRYPLLAAYLSGPINDYQNCKENFMSVDTSFFNTASGVLFSSTFGTLNKGNIQVPKSRQFN